MSDSLSAQLLREMNEQLSSDENEPISIGEIDFEYTLIPGLRKGSNLVWVPEEKCLYYKNAYSKITSIESCKCYKPKCSARLYIRKNGTAYRHSSVQHSKGHGSMYKEFITMHCFNKMKKAAEIAPASETSFQIYTEVIKE